LPKTAPMSSHIPETNMIQKSCIQ